MDSAMRIPIRSAILVLMLTVAWGQSSKSAKTDEEIRLAIIKESIASYRGNCPCPYSRDRAGRQCGRRSAYSKPGGTSHLCYPKDVTPKMVEEYRKRSRS